MVGMSKVHLRLFATSKSYRYRTRYIQHTACGFSWENNATYYTSKEAYDAQTEKSELKFAYPAQMETVTCSECLVMVDALLADGCIKYANHYGGVEILFTGKHAGNNRLRTFKSYLAKFGKEMGKEITYIAHFALSSATYQELPDTELDYYVLSQDDDYEEDVYY